MIRKLAALAALLSPLCSAHAEQSSWSFVYTGFDVATISWDGETTKWNPAANIKGKFSGTDSNGDGMLVFSELSLLQVDGFDYVGCSWGTCHSDYTFNYTPNGQLDFKVRRFSNDPEGYVFWSTVYETGASADFTTFTLGTPSGARYAWTPQTTLSIAAAVPEPSSYAMVLTGLLLVGVAGWVRRAR
ncbi:PEP-CTERM sorting domain-containing protein [Massilia sp. CCM 8733]|uniref:PEP-CTERM sorting domain-containing protein n=1 Tax=Massilia mucilaginosa TaxID=2609282 RepID=A0ABX0P3E4_9BURK|nr:PEP-CTERM sorting domain-containing protein [Massilia mucilaginosa]NHZ93236.1 PEP-CTERM sorting domain-containing protein [Massilia mucilaginosa]